MARQIFSVGLYLTQSLVKGEGTLNVTGRALSTCYVRNGTW